MVNPPKHWDTPSGAVIKAIVFEDKHLWRDIQKVTSFTENDLNAALAVLYNENVLFREDRGYYVIPELASEYQAYLGEQDDKTGHPTDVKTPPNSSGDQPNLIKSPILNQRILFVVILIIGLVIGGSASALLSNSKIQRLRKDITVLENELSSTLSQLSDASINQSYLEDQVNSLQGNLSDKQEKVDNLTSSMIQSHMLIDEKDQYISGLVQNISSLGDYAQYLELELEEESQSLSKAQEDLTIAETTIISLGDEVDDLESQVQILEDQISGSGGTGVSDFIFVEASFSRTEDTSSRLQYWIGRAQNSIKIMMYLITQNDLANALMSAHDRGVQITVIIDNDWVSSSGSDYQELKNYGIDTRHDDRSGLMHHKVMIIDDYVVVVGSYNWSASAEDSNDENILILKSTIIADEYLDEFDRLLSQTSSQTPTTTYSLEISVSGSGSTSPSVGSYSYNAGSSVSVSASPSSEWDFSHWLLDGENFGSQNPIEVSMDEDHTLQAVFVEESSPPSQYTLTISTSGSGSTSPSAGSYSYDEGTSVSVTANPGSGWDFDHWTLDGQLVGSQNPYSVTMNDDHSLTAVFVEESQPEGYVVINEVEQNPPGNDNYGSVYEWVELYNPSSYAVDLSGWTLTATGGTPVIKTISQGTVLQPGQWLVIQSGSQWLDNTGEKVVLKDDQGSLKNQTPTLNDNENDDRSWQRSSDGGSNWVFKSSTKNSSN